MRPFVGCGARNNRLASQSSHETTKRASRIDPRSPISFGAGPTPLFLFLLLTFGLRPAFDVLAVGMLIGLSVGDPTFRVALGVELFASRAAVGRAFGWHESSPL